VLLASLARTPTESLDRRWGLRGYSLRKRRQFEILASIAWCTALPRLAGWSQELPAEFLQDVHCFLPACSTIKQRLLQYATSALLFADLNVNPSLVSWNRWGNLKVLLLWPRVEMTNAMAAACSPQTARHQTYPASHLFPASCCSHL
jgi:hypothetical protein